MTNNKLQARLNPVKFRNYLKRLDKEAQIGAREAMFMALEELTRRILAETPRDSGTLRDSYSFEVKARNGSYIGHFGFGWQRNPLNPKSGLSARDYMLYVHEDLNAHHDVGKAKFLEDPVRQFNQDFRNIATMTIMKRLNGRKI